MDELLDLVDLHDNVIDQKMRSEVHLKKMTNFRVVNAFVLNDQGQLWIPIRAKSKALYPLCLDASMSGHVSSGETYEESFIREVMEELRIDATSIPYECIAKLTPHEHGTEAFIYVFLLRLNDVPNFNTDDYIGFQWLTPDEVLDHIKKGDKAKADLPIMIKLLKHRF